MSDTVLVALIAALSAIVGGLASSIPTLWSQNRRWKVEMKLEHLRKERHRKEELYRKTLEEIQEGMKKNSFRQDLLADIFAFMPKSIEEKFMACIASDKNEMERRVALLEISMERVLPRFYGHLT